MGLLGSTPAGTCGVSVTMPHNIGSLNGCAGAHERCLPGPRRRDRGTGTCPGPDGQGRGTAPAGNGAGRGPGTGTGGAAAVTGTAITGPAASESMLDSAWPPSW